MIPLLLTALSAPAHAGTPYFGLEWRPLSRQDLVWVEENRTSGTAVGEFDGTVKPVFSAFGGGWINRWFGIQAGLGLARITSTSFVDDTFRTVHRGVFRPSLDFRFGWAEQRLQAPVPWVMLGVYGDVPSARDVSNGFTEDEQAAADESSVTERARLGGVGGRLGFGVDYRLLPGLSIGALATVGLHRSTFAGGDDSFASIWVSSEAALLLTFEWPGEARRNAARAELDARRSARRNARGQVDEDPMETSSDAL
jgi:hypothetical protein